MDSGGFINTLLETERGLIISDPGALVPIPIEWLSGTAPVFYVVITIVVVTLILYKAGIIK